MRISDASCRDDPRDPDLRTLSGAVSVLRLLLDENLPHSLRLRLGSHEVQTAAYAGFAGLSNGRLLDAAEEAGFDVLVTGDRTLHYEQNLTSRKIAIVSLSTINWPILEPHIAEIARGRGCGLFLFFPCGQLRDVSSLISMK